MNTSRLLVAAAALCFATAVQADKGQEVYDTHCKNCHLEGLINAPKFGDKVAWAPRLAANTVETFLATVKTGKAAMPPKGTCAECTDEDLKAGIEYMMSAVQ